METFKRENFHEFRGFMAIRESFLREIWGMASFGTAKANNPQKFSPQISNSQKFSPSKVSRYTVGCLLTSNANTFSLR